MALKPGESTALSTQFMMHGDMGGPHDFSTILEKLHLNNRIELATYAVAHHLFEKLGRE
jgi:hypothetical protein